MEERSDRQKRVNHPTQVFSRECLIGTIYKTIDQLSSNFEEKQFHERRKSKRCPISARVFLSDNKVFQGVCRDVSSEVLRFWSQTSPKKRVMLLK